MAKTNKRKHPALGKHSGPRKAIQSARENPYIIQSTVLGYQAISNGSRSYGISLHSQDPYGNNTYRVQDIDGDSEDVFVEGVLKLSSWF